MGAAEKKKEGRAEKARPVSPLSLPIWWIHGIAKSGEVISVEEPDENVARIIAAGINRRGGLVQISICKYNSPAARWLPERE